jgi:hypothetical protein
MSFSEIDTCVKIESLESARPRRRHFQDSLAHWLCCPKSSNAVLSLSVALKFHRQFLNQLMLEEASLNIYCFEPDIKILVWYFTQIRCVSKASVAGGNSLIEKTILAIRPCLTWSIDSYSLSQYKFETILTADSCATSDMLIEWSHISQIPPGNNEFFCRVVSHRFYRCHKRRW